MNIKLSIVLCVRGLDDAVFDSPISPGQFSSPANDGPLTVCVSDPHDLKRGPIKPVSFQYINTMYHQKVGKISLYIAYRFNF